MWPPSRSRRRAARSSRLTGEPTSSAPSEERAQRLVHDVGGEAAVLDRGGGEADAVDGDGVPFGDLGREAGGDPQPRAVAGRLDAGDGAPVFDEPGEHAHHTCSRAVIRMSSPDGSESSAIARIASEIFATPSPSSGSRALRPPSSSGATNSRDLVDLAGVEERAGQVRPAFEHERGDGQVELAELVERVGDARRLVLAGRGDDVGARHLERLGRRAPRGARDDDGERDLGGVADELGVDGQARGGVEDDPARLAVDVGQARGQPRVVGQRGADADDDGVDLGAPVVRELAALLAGDPLRVAVARGDLAVEAHRGLEEHPGPAGAGVLAERLVLEPRTRAPGRRRRRRRRRPRRAGCPGRVRWPSRSGRRWRRRRG